MQTVTIPQAFDLALQHLGAGRLAEAEAIYRQILAVEPDHVGSLHNLGVIANQTGRHEVAAEMIRRAAVLVPNEPVFYSNLGIACRKLGRLDDAIAAYRRAVELKPDFAGAWFNLGNALRQQGQFDEAVTAYRRAIEIQPDYADAHNNAGNTLSDLGRFGEAIAAYRPAIQLKPDFAEAHNNLGNALKNTGRHDEAIAAFRRALRLRPDYPEAHNNLGTVLKQQGQIDEAIAAYRRALELKPDYAEAENNLGAALGDQGHIDDALSACRRALELKPDFAPAHYNLGIALREKGRMDEAIASYQQAIGFKPDYAEAHNNLGLALRERGNIEESIAAHRRAIQLKPDLVEAHNNLGVALTEQGRVEEALAACRDALRLKPDDSELHGVHGNLLLFSQYLPDSEAEPMFREHCRWDEIYARPLAKFIESHRNDRDPRRRLRIGYVSPDFREHSVAFFFEGLIASHDRDEFEVFCYADALWEDAVTARLRQHAGHWRRIANMRDAQAANLVREDAIDILVDLSGHTARNRLPVFARKPAPIQVTWLGYPDTTGMSAMDYRLTDAYADPPGATEHLHCEHLIRLPEVFACFRPVEDSPPVGSLPALQRGYVTFASLHRLAKLNERVLESWATLLLKVPDSRLLMAAAGLDETSSRRRLLDFFAGRGVATERLEFKGRQLLPTYLALHNEVDLLLDSYPFSGHTTGCHALWMGLPVVTFAGDRQCSRMVASVLANLGLSDLIAHTSGECVKIASELAGDLPRLAELRSTLRERMRTSPVTDAPRFARNVEQAYREMWRAWCAGPAGDRIIAGGAGG